MKKAIILSSFLLLAGAVSAQTPLIWSKTYGGNGADRGHCIRNTADGGFVISGYTDSDNNGDVSGYKGGADIWVVKLNNAGNLEWQSAYGGFGAEPWTVAYTNILQTADGGYLVTGESFSKDGDLTESHGNIDLWAFKIDNDGDIEWQHSLGGNNHEGAFSVVQETDGGFLMAGYTSSTNGDVTSPLGLNDGWLVKLSATGDLLWQKTMGGSWTDALTSIQHTKEGGYIAAGYTLSDNGDLTGLNPDGFAGLADYWVAKLDKNADIEWQSVLGGTKDDKAISVIQAPDGGYVVAGITESDNGDVSESFGEWDWWIVKLDNTGSLVWEKSMGGSKRDEVRFMEPLSDGSGFFIVGTTQSTDGSVSTNHGEKDIWFLKMDYSGNIISNRCFGGDGNEVGFSGIESADGAIVITGHTNSDTNGDIVEDTQGADLWVFKLGGTTGIKDFSRAQLSVYPNPATDVLYFSEPIKTAAVYTISGQKLITVSNSNRINISSLSAGSYLLQTQDAEGTPIMQTIVKQ